MAQPVRQEARGSVESSAPGFGANALIATAVVVAALYVGRDVLVPFVVAVLLSFVLAVPIKMLQNLGLGRGFPVAFTVLVAFLVLVSIAGVVSTQLAQLAGDLPRYQTTIRSKIAGLKDAASGNRTLENAATMLQNLSNELGFEDRGPSSSAAGGDSEARRPIPVEIAGTRATPVERIANLVAPLLHPLATTGLVVIFVVFILLQRGDLRNRLIRLAGSKDLQRTTAALNDAVRRLSRFFVTQLLLNSTFGLVVGLGLWAIGIPSPVLWGIMAAISRFIPYVGVVLAAGGPLILAAAVDPHWSMLIWTASFFLAIEILVGQVVEPLLYGHSTGLSPIAVIASVTFWTLLWGPIGLLLATPLTVCLVVLGRHVEHLEFLDVMLGDRPPLTLPETFYQRALAGDAGEATDQAERFLKTHRLATYYDEVAIKGLALAQADLSRGALDAARLDHVSETVAEVIDNLSEHEDDGTVADPKEAKKEEPAGQADDEDEVLARSDAAVAALPVLAADGLAAGWAADATVLCVAGRSVLDRAAADMLAQVLRKHGIGATVEGAETLTASGISHLPAAATRIVCLSYLDSSSPVHVRYAARRLRRRLPDATLVVCSWGIGERDAAQVCQAARSDHCAGRLVEAVDICLKAATAVPPAAAAAQPSAAAVQTEPAASAA